MAFTDPCDSPAPTTKPRPPCPLHGRRHPRTHDRMNALTLTLIRLGFLAVLWLFVIAAVGVVRTDLFGSATSARRQRRHRTDLFGSATSARRQRRQRAAARPRPP